ncbi:MAG: protease modulator HflC [Rhodospirillales bacterium]|nr:protease modulator HflC [Rhodospirillales bacterium]
MNKPLLIILAILAVGLIAASQIFFIVDQRQQAIVLQLGQPVGDINGPGLHVKIPVIQTVQYFDSRILSVDPEPEQVVISSSLIEKQKQSEEGEEQPEKDASSPAIEDVSGEPIIVDTFARYKIVAPLQFFKTLRTIHNANSRLQNILNDATRTVLGKTTLKELLSPQRELVMKDILSRVNKKIEQDKLGINIVDIRIVRADLTAALLTSTVDRMVSELNQRATETRAKGDEAAQQIRSTADKESRIILAEAQRDASIVKGQGDKEAIKIYADAFNKDIEFYSFIRSMEAYKNTLADPATQLILSPDSEFFKHFDDNR